MNSRISVKSVSLLLLTVLLAGPLAQAKIDVTQFKLTEPQISLIDRLEKRGYSDEDLTKLAQSFERSNAPQVVYIPAYTSDQLYAVLDWAEGGAFASFSTDAKIKFDLKAYLADCPNMALFNFGRANGTQYIGVDVLWKFNPTAVNLNSKLQEDPQAFRAVYLEIIRPTQFAKYIPAAEWDMDLAFETN